MCKMISFCQLILISALTWSVAVSSKLVGAKKSEFHMMMENNWPDPDPNINHFPHPTSCHYYYLFLSEEDISIKKCPEDKLFDYFLHKCVEKESARCWSRRFSEIIHDHNHMHKAPKKFKCPNAYGKFPDITDCARYYQCLSGIAKIKKCAPFEYFDKIKRKCIAEIKAVCADETDVVEHGYKCPRTEGWFSFSKDCSKYYECIEKRPDLKTCPKYRVFDEKTRKCISNEVVQCGSRYNPYEDLVTSSEPTAVSLQERTEKITDDQEATPETVSPQTSSFEIEDNEIESSITSSKSNNKVIKEVNHNPIKDNDSSENDIPDESQESSEDHHKNDLKGLNEGPSQHNTKETKKELHEDNSEESKENSHDDNSKESKENSHGDNSKESRENSHDDNSKESKENSHDDNSKESKENSHDDNSKESTGDRDLESSVIDEFITPVRTSSVEILTNQETITESNRVTSEEIHPITKDDKTCHPKDVTCVREKSRILRCPDANGFFPHPKDERRFLHCFNFRIFVKECPKRLVFRDSLKACTLPLDQAEKNI